MKININKKPEDYEPWLIQGYLMKIDFFNNYGYNPKYPTHQEFSNILIKAKENRLIKEDIDEIANIFMRTFDREEYEEYYKKAQESVNLAEDILNKNKELFARLNKTFGFKIFSKYELRITKYGPGGSSDFNRGRVISRCDFKNLTQTLIHEIVHIGIHEAIIKEYNIDHVTKEYIVDMFVKNNFKKEFPNYKVQEFKSQKVNETIKDNIKDDFNWERLKQVASKSTKANELI